MKRILNRAAHYNFSISYFRNTKKRSSERIDTQEISEFTNEGLRTFGGRMSQGGIDRKGPDIEGAHGRHVQ